MKRVLGLITARGGSKGIPGKNIKMIAGKPLIAWTIEEAVKSKLLDRVIVSTDSEEIAEVSRKYGAEVPWMRPKELAQDDTKHIDVVLHAIALEKCPAYCLLQPTSPLRTAEDIDGAIEKFQEIDKKVIGVTLSTEYYHIFDYHQNVVFSIESYHTVYQELPRQKIEPRCLINGAVYVNDSGITIMSGVIGGDGYGYVMPKERSYQIDDMIDFDICEMLLRKRNG